jgi:hypothetical protein
MCHYVIDSYAAIAYHCSYNLLASLLSMKTSDVTSATLVGYGELMVSEQTHPATLIEHIRQLSLFYWSSEGNLKIPGVIAVHDCRSPSVFSPSAL